MCRFLQVVGQCARVLGAPLVGRGAGSGAVRGMRFACDAALRESKAVRAQTTKARIFVTSIGWPRGRFSRTCLYLHRNQADYDFEPEEDMYVTPHRVRPCRRG